MEHHILLFEKPAPISASLISALQAAGYPLHTASSTAEAFRMLKTFPIAVCLMDLKSDDTSQQAFFRNLLTTDPLVKILVIAARPNYETAVKAVKMGAFDYTSNRIGPGNFLKLMEKALAFRADEMKLKGRTKDAGGGLVLICHHQLIRTGLETFCREYPFFNLMHAFHSVDFIKNSDFNHQASLILLCHTCNPAMRKEGEDIFSRVKLFFPNGRPVILNHEPDHNLEKEWIRLGVKGFIPANTSMPLISRAFQTIMKDQIWVSREVSQALLSDLLAGKPAPEYRPPTPPYQLTRREVEILQAIASGLSNVDISNKFFISEKTVKAHTNHIFKKMAVKSRTQAVKKAMEKKII